MTKSVIFIAAHTLGSLYNVGDIAGFENETADDLIKRGIAEAHTGKKAPTTLPTGFTIKKVGEGWSVFSGRKEVIKGLADQNAAEAWVAEQAIRQAPPEARQVGETWSVFSGDTALVESLADEAAAKVWIADQVRV